MPAYSQLQTYIRYSDDAFPAIIEAYGRVLRQLGFADAWVSEWLASLSWTPADDGFVYTGCDGEPAKIQVGGVFLRVRPHLLGWTRELPHPVVDLELLFESEQLEDPQRDWSYRSGVESGLWSAALLLAEQFPDCGVFLTNEVTDGVPFKGLITGDRSKLFRCDLAIIPSGIRHQFADLPDWCTQLELPGGGLAIADTRVWQRLPWQAEGRPR